MKQKTYIIFFLLGTVLFPQMNYAQVDFNKKPDDDLGNLEDAFQEHFFEALKQKSIENYQRAVDALLKCEKLDDSKTVVYYELGKNYNKLKNFGAAENALKKAISKEPDNEWYLDELYDVYNQQGDTDKAIKTIMYIIVGTCGGFMVLLFLATIIYRQKYMFAQKFAQFTRTHEVKDLEEAQNDDDDDL